MISWCIPLARLDSGAQASIVAYFDLYSGCGATVPTVDWAYDTGGVITGAPSFSFDGSQMAFMQTTAGVASLVLLRIPLTPPGAGTVDAPVTLHAGLAVGLHDLRGALHDYVSLERRRHRYAIQSVDRITPTLPVRR